MISDPNEMNIEIDWFDELNDEQQQDILEVLKEADNGETIPHVEVVKLFAKWGMTSLISKEL
jgi:predicted transcriptional regulator